MGLFKGVKEKLEQGLAKELEKHKEQMSRFLMEDEELEAIYPLITDSVGMTDWRLIYIGRPSLLKGEIKTGKQFVSIPYDKIVEVRMEVGDVYSFSNKVIVVTPAEAHVIPLPKNISEEEVHDFYQRLLRKIR